MVVDHGNQWPRLVLQGDAHVGTEYLPDRRDAQPHPERRAGHRVRKRCTISVDNVCAQHLHCLVTRPRTEITFASGGHHGIARGLIGVDAREVRRNRLDRLTALLKLTALQPRDLIAQTLELSESVAHDDDRATRTPQRIQVVEALALEFLIAHREHFVDQKHVGLHVHRDREPQAHIHATGVVLNRFVDELGESTEVDDLAGDLGDLLARQTEDRPIECDVLAAAHVGVEARTQLDERRDATLRGDAAFGGPIDAADHLQQRRLARTVVADESVDTARLHVEGDVAHGPEVLGATAAPAHDALLE